MKTKLQLTFLLLMTMLTVSNLARAEGPAGTAFDYQGRLNDNGSPAYGNYDLQFYLRDVLALGNPVGPTNTISPVPVTNGLFAVSLDFGSAAFGGLGRWLEIGVRPHGSVGAYFTLSPRQELTPSSYAIFAYTASNVVNGSVVKSLNNLKDNVTLAAGSNVTITPSGNTLTLAAAGAGGSGIWSVLNNNASYNAGNVGIGTTSPSGRLHVAGDWDGEQGALQLSGHRPTIRFTGNADTGNQSWLLHLGSVGPGALYFFRRTGLGAYSPVLALNPNSDALLSPESGNVGIGTYTPTSKLEVVAQDALRLIGPQPFLTLSDSTAGYARSRIRSVGGGLDLFTEDYLSGANPFSFLRLANNGNVGIGSATPVAKLEVVGVGGGGDALRLIGYQPFLTLLDSNAGYARSRIQGAGGDLFLETHDYMLSGNPLNGLIVLKNGTSYVGIGTASPQALLDVAGTARVKVLTITGGADLAEPFEFTASDIAKGSVVIIDSENPGKLKLSDQPYDQRVAGVVSGANGVNPGISLHQEGILEGGQNVALSGRVYVQADAAFGAIKPGDLLTTSAIPGHAMKVSDHAKAQGAILGKAMSTLKEGKGVVLVLVTLQ